MKVKGNKMMKMMKKMKKLERKRSRKREREMMKVKVARKTGKKKSLYAPREAGEQSIRTQCPPLITN